MEHISSTDTSTVLSLNTETAFDSVGWEHFCSTLQTSVSHLFLKNFYHSPTARRQISGSVSDSVPLRGAEIPVRIVN